MSRIFFLLLFLNCYCASLEANPRPSPLQIATDLGQKALPYVWGGTDPQQGGFDCSGFVRYVYQQAYGLTLPDEAGLQYEYLRKYGRVWDRSTARWSFKDLRPGDLIFYSGTAPTTRPSPITHVMMYCGNGKMVGAQSMGSRLGVKGCGVGFYQFYPRPPSGHPLRNLPEYRTRLHLFAYGRVFPPPSNSTQVMATINLP